MSLSGTLSIALSGLATAQKALGVTANNVANANTEGYTRKVAKQETVVFDGQGAGSQVLEPTRVVDEYLAKELREERSELGRSETLVGYHDRLSSVYGTPGASDSGLTNAFDRLTQAATALAGTPESSAQRLGLVGAVEDLGREIGNAADQVQLMRGDADQEIKTTVDAINADLDGLSRLNGELARNGGSVELLDQRDQLLTSLSERLQISVTRQDDQQVTIYARGGQVLLDNGAARHLQYAPAAQVAANSSFGPIKVYAAKDIDPQSGNPRAGARGDVLVTGGVRAELTPELQADATDDADQIIRSPFTAGKLQGLIEARDQLLPKLADQIGELTSITRYALNAAHNASAAASPPASLSGTRTDLTGFDASANAGTAYLAVVDRASGTALSTMAINLGGASPADIVAQINAGLGSQGTALFDSTGALRITLADANQGLALNEGTSSIAGSDLAGHDWTYGFSHYFGLNDLVVPDAAGGAVLSVRPDIATDGAKLAVAHLDVTPGPPLNARLGSKGDNRGAQALTAGLDQSIQTVSRGDLSARRASIGQYTTDIVATGAVKAKQASSDEASDRALVDDLAYREASVSGVNVDEELSRLVTYQQAYTVSARIVSITNDLFDELINLGR